MFHKNKNKQQKQMSKANRQTIKKILKQITLSKFNSNSSWILTSLNSPRDVVFVMCLFLITSYFLPPVSALLILVSLTITKFHISSVAQKKKIWYSAAEDGVNSLLTS